MASSQESFDHEWASEEEKEEMVGSNVLGGQWQSSGVHKTLERPVFAVDWDSTCAVESWPEIGDWLPGARKGLRELADIGRTVIYSLRIKNHELDDQTLRPSGAAQEQVDAIRFMLDRAGLEDVSIYPAEKGKPPAKFYIDDRAIAFDGDWRLTLDEVRERENRHPNSARFHQLLRQVGTTHDKKQRDYGKGDDPFANVRASEEWGIPAWVGAMVRAGDKVRRLQSFVQNGTLANEGVEDSLLDLAVYSVIAMVLFEEES